MPRYRLRKVKIGDKYGRWTVLEFSGKDKRGALFWKCRCECTAVKDWVQGRCLLNGESTSCGCYWREKMTPHGMTGTRTFKSWESMKQRCTNPKAPDYPRYGALGVEVCARWAHSFENFYEDMGERPPGMTIDRHPDPYGNYEPTNCRWATAEQQQRNKRNTHYITYRGDTKMLIDWSREIGIPYDLLLRRANRGLEGDALFAPSRSRKTSRFDGL